jgi:leucine-rich repeat protein SHOC2
MSKRERILNINTLNRLNEEDENTLVDEDRDVEEKNALDASADYTVEKQKLKDRIDDVFKVIPCSESNTLLDDQKRLESLEQLFINRFLFNISNTQTYENINNTNLLNKMSSSVYSSHLSDSFNELKFDDNREQFDEKSLFVNKVHLNDECLRHFSLKRLKSHTKSNRNDNSNNNEDNNNDWLQITQNINKIELIDLSKNNLRTLPINLLAMFKNLQIIDLSENSFESINLISLTRFTSLKELNLSSNMLKWFTANIENTIDDQIVESFKDQKQDDKENPISTTLLVSIERLNLANNQLESSNCLIISQFKNLKYLNLSNNNFQINAIDSQLPWLLSGNHLKNLLELNLSKNNKPSNALTSKFDRTSLLSRQSSTRSSIQGNYLKPFNCFINLKVLNLSENNLFNMPNDIKDLKNLEELNLNKNNLAFIPNELVELRNLKSLSLSDNKINELNENFCTFSNFKNSLINLDLSKNQLKYDNFSYKIAVFEELKVLNLSENQFESIPNTLPKNLEELDMSKNKIKTLMVRPLSQAVRSDDDVLKALNLSELKKKNKEFDFLMQNEKVVPVKQENVYDQPEIDHKEELLVPHVFYLRNLKVLCLRDNQIQEIPNDFGILNSNLVHVDLSFNLISQMGLAMCRGLIYLKHLNLSNNRLRELTDKLRELNALEYLDLSNNRLLKLNYELCNDMKSLKELYLNNNNLESLPYFGTNADLQINVQKQEANTKPSVLSAKSQKTHVTQASNEHSKFCFNLENLSKIDLSQNKFKGLFSIYKSFALSSKVTDINLASNKITQIEVGIAENSIKRSRLNSIKNELIDQKHVKILKIPKHRLSHLEKLNLSNNEIEFKRGGLVRLLVNIYKLAPNLKSFIYSQENGNKLGNVNIDPLELENINLINNIANINNQLNAKNNNATNLQQNANTININDDYYFDYDGYEAENDDHLTATIPDMKNGADIGSNLIERKIDEHFEILLEKLQVLDISNNNLKKVPGFLYKLKNLKEIYLNGNCLTKIPNEMFKLPESPEDEAKFERLKKLQRQREEEERLRKLRQENGEEENENDEEGDEDEQKKKKKKKKKNKTKPLQIEPVNDSKQEQSRVKPRLLAESLEVIHLNDNKIEHVPENLFSNFKYLKEIKLTNNPLKEPPHESIFINSNLIKKESPQKPKSSSLIETIENIQITNNNSTQTKNSRAYFSSDLAYSPNKLNKKMSQSEDKLPNIFFEINDSLRPFQSYMVKYKKREGKSFTHFSTQRNEMLLLFLILIE